MNADSSSITIRDGWTVDVQSVIRYRFLEKRLKLTIATAHGEYSVYLDGEEAEMAHLALNGASRLTTGVH